MFKTRNFLRRRHLLILLMAFFSQLLPQKAAADDGYDTYVDLTWNYNVYMSGSNTLTITAPCYDQEGADAYIIDGNLYASWEGQEWFTLIHWSLASDGQNSISGDAQSCPVRFSTQAGGHFNVTPGNTTRTRYLSSAGGDTFDISRNDDKTTFNFSAVWVMPREVLGKTLKLRWHVQRNGTGRGKVWLDNVGGLKSPGDIAVTEAPEIVPPFVTPATINRDKKGKIEVPWVMTGGKVKKLRYEYIDANQKTVSETLTPAENGIITLNAYEPHRNFQIIANYEEEHTVDSYLIEDAASEPMDLTMIHAPHGLTATPLGGIKPKVEVKWNIGNIADEDITQFDFFEIQRSLTGKEEDFVTIGQHPYTGLGENTEMLYTYVDSTIVDAIAEEMLKDGYTLDSLTYRVRRTISQVWEWEDNPCAGTATCMMDNLHLLRFADYSAKLEDDSYNVRVSWKYAEESGGVWDDRAKMILRITSKNKAGEVVEVKEVELNKEDRELCYKVVDLSRPCLLYDIELLVDRNKSPLNLYDETQMKEYFFPIRNEADWTTFRDKVAAAKGQYDVNARLYTDIPETDVFIGWGTDHAYRGTFDGNGHTLSVKAPYDSPYMAPFRYVGNATIKNLHTTGTIKTGKQFQAGLIGNIYSPGSTVTIENCRSSVVLSSPLDYNNANGGFIGSVANNSNVTIRNCKFDGAFEGDKSDHNGGFIGWVNSGSKIVIDNCLFAPDHIATEFDGCETWARLSDATLDLKNSYATREYTSVMIISNAEDWKKFQTMVENAKNQYDVNAILAADITTESYIGAGETAYYRGTFDGNGHTLTFNKSGWTERFIAPFRVVGNATIKNLHTAGTIETSEMYPAGIIGEVYGGGTATIENCRSSMTLKSSWDGDGTIAGLAGRISSSSVVIRNSKFDGKLEGEKCWGNGGFVSWVDSKSSATIENCLFMPEHVSAHPQKSETWARKDESGTVTIKNCYATKEFVHLISNTSDWNEFVSALASRGNKPVNALLAADISISTPASNFKGVFDGNGHTVELGIAGGTMFNSANDYTIKNLHVTGNVSGDMHISGLVYSSEGSERVYIENCWVSTSIHCDATHAGGFIGHGNETPHTINNCLFDGAISAKNDGKNDGTAYVGSFLGWVGDVDHHVTNCLDDGKFYYCDHAGFCYTDYSAWGNKGNSSNNYTYKGVSWSEVHYTGIRHDNIDYVVQQLGSGWYASADLALPKMATRSVWNNVGSLSASTLAEHLGTGHWEVVDDKVVPKVRIASLAVTDADVLDNLASWTKDGETIVPTTTTVTEPQYSTIVKPTLPDFYHTSTGVIDKELLTETRQSSVEHRRQPHRLLHRAAPRSGSGR